MKGLYGNIGVLISDNSLSSEIVTDISNLGSASSNWNSRNVKDHDKNPSDLRSVLVIISTLIPYLTNLATRNNTEITQGKIDILVITETKADSTFPLNQFSVQGYSKPYRFDRNRKGGGVSSRELKIHSTPQDIESIFIQINLIKTR